MTDDFKELLLMAKLRVCALRNEISISKIVGIVELSQDGANRSEWGSIMELNAKKIEWPLSSNWNYGT